MRARKPKRLPTVLSREEVGRVLAQLHGERHMVATLLYGTGLRLMEPLRLCTKDIDLGSRQLVIRQAKGATDRVTVLPQCLPTPLHAHLHKRKREHDVARATEGGRVRLSAALAMKYVNNDTSWPWQWVFAAGHDYRYHQEDRMHTLRLRGTREIQVSWRRIVAQ